MFSKGMAMDSEIIGNIHDNPDLIRPGIVQHGTH